MISYFGFHKNSYIYLRARRSSLFSMGNRQTFNQGDRKMNAPGAAFSPVPCKLVGIESLHLTSNWNVIEDTKTSLVANHKTQTNDSLSISLIFTTSNIEQQLAILTRDLKENENNFISLGAQKVTINGNEAALEHCSYIKDNGYVQRITCVICNGYPMLFSVTYVAQRLSFDEAGFHQFISGLIMTRYENMHWETCVQGNMSFSYPYGYEIGIDDDDEVTLYSPIQVATKGVIENVNIQEVVLDQPMMLRQQLDMVLDEVMKESKFRREKVEKVVMGNGKNSGVRVKVRYEIMGRLINQAYYLTGEKKRFLLAMCTSSIGPASFTVGDRIARSIEWPLL
jgi:hypothetical protein